MTAYLDAAACLEVTAYLDAAASLDSAPYLDLARPLWTPPLCGPRAAYLDSAAEYAEAIPAASLQLPRTISRLTSTLDPCVCEWM